MPKPPSVEHAIDAIREHLQALPIDERLLILARIAEPFGLQVVAAERAQPEAPAKKHKRRRIATDDRRMGARFRELRLRLCPDLARHQTFGDALHPPVTAQTIRNWEHGRHIPDKAKRASARSSAAIPKISTQRSMRRSSASARAKPSAPPSRRPGDDPARLARFSLP
jgi:hypothetical protein